MPMNEPDYRFSLANERTFLAYLRTALACYAGGLAAVQFLDLDGKQWLTRLMGIALVLAGIGATVGAWRRFRQNQVAMRNGDPLPDGRLPVLLTATIGVVGLCGLLFSILR